jgi:drug/metabolite transporter, DME family
MSSLVELQRRREVSHRAGRLWIVVAALLWSSSGVFAKSAVFDDWALESRGAILGFWRALFAGLLLLPFVRRPRWTPRLVPMTLSFAGMNATFLTAMTLTTAANAIWLQSTAPLWVFAIGLIWRTEPFDRRNLVPVACAAAGVGLILYHEIAGDARTGVACGLAAGLFYASVIISLRGLRDEDSAWLVAINHLIAAAALAPYVLWLGIVPSGQQLFVLAAFGMLQMAIPYLCFARGLRGISGQEASGIGLIEPVIMPLWVFLASSEVPAWWTLAGGGLIFAGLAWRYLRPKVPETL